MAATRVGGLKAAETNRKKNPDFYREIGRRGGLAKGPKGFAVMEKDKVRAAGRKGGKISRRTYVNRSTE